MDCGPPGFSVHGISQGRILEWVAIPFSRGSSRPRDQTQVSRIAGSILGWLLAGVGGVHSREVGNDTGGRTDEIQIKSVLIVLCCTYFSILTYVPPANVRDSFNPWSEKTPHATGQLGPSAILLSRCSGAHELQLLILKPAHSRACAPQQKEATTMISPLTTKKSRPHLLQLEKASVQQ